MLAKSKTPRFRDRATAPDTGRLDRFPEGRVLGLSEHQRRLQGREGEELA